MTTNYIPEGYHTVTPYLIVKGAAKAIEFYQKVFGAKEIMRFPDEKTGKIGHAELQIGDSRVSLADEHPEVAAVSPQTVGGTPVQLVLYVADVDAVVKRAVEEGARVERPVEDQFYGDRTGGVVDPFGHRWHIATHKEDVTEEELQRRAAAQK